MSRHHANFIIRTPGPSHTSNDAYRRDRYDMYGTEAPGFPTQRARNTHLELEESTARGDWHREDYRHGANRSRGYVQQLPDPLERQYYDTTTGGYTPRDNRLLIAPAEEWLESELESVSSPKIPSGYYLSPFKTRLVTPTSGKEGSERRYTLKPPWLMAISKVNESTTGTSGSITNMPTVPIALSGYIGPTQSTDPPSRSLTPFATLLH